MVKKVSKKKEIYIEEDYVSFKTAKKLHKAGFTQIPRVGIEAVLYTRKGYPTKYANYGMYNSGLDKGYIPRPTIQMAQAWIWKKYKLWIQVDLALKVNPEDNNKWFYYLRDQDGETLYKRTTKYYDTPAEAYEKAILYMLKNIEKW